MTEWSTEEEKYLKENYKEKRSKEIGRELGRSAKAIRDRAYSLGLKKNPDWTEEEIQFLRENFGDMTAQEISEKMNRTEVAVRDKAGKLGLKSWRKWWEEDKVHRCSKCGEIKPVENFPKWKRRGEYRRTGVCRECIRERNRKNDRRKRERANKLIEKAKDRPCALCGKQYPASVMDFHHIEEKGNEVSKMRNYSVEAIKKEMEKCVILCCNCHRMLENTDIYDDIDLEEKTLHFPEIH